MKRFRQYLFLENKKMFLELPKLLLGSFLLLAAVLICFSVFHAGLKNREENPPILIGILAEKDEPFIDWFIKAMQDMPDMGFSFEIRRIEKEEADTFFTKETNVLFLVPKNYISSIIDGENKHLTIRFSKAQTTIVNSLIRELSEAASSFILDTEAGIYTMQDYYREHHLSDAKKDELLLNIKYVQEIISFEDALDIQAPEVQSASVTSNYLASGIVLFSLFLGLIFAPVMTSEGDTLKKQLTRYYLNMEKQVLARETTFLLAIFFIFMLFSLVFFIVHLSGISFIKETVLSGTFGIFFLLFGCIPVFFYTASFSLFVYELTGDSLSGILLLFFSNIFMGLFSGFFYPMQYLPGLIQKLALILPTTHAHTYVHEILTSGFKVKEVIVLLSDTIFFYFTTVWILKLRQN